MGEIEDVQTFLNTNGIITIGITGFAPTSSWGRLKLGNEIYRNSITKEKVTEYSLHVVFSSSTTYTTFITALDTNINKFNLRQAIAGYSRPAALLFVKINRTATTEQENLIKITYILNVTRTM
jgi:hypothetical protein